MGLQVFSSLCLIFQSVVFSVKEEFVDMEHVGPKNSIAINIKEDVKDSYPLGLARDYQSEV